MDLRVKTRAWWGRAASLAAAAGVALLALSATPAQAADPTTVATAPPTLPPASISGSVVPSVTINRAPTPAATQPPQTQAPRPQATQPSGTRATTASAGTAARATATTAPVATTVAPTIAAATTVAPTTAASTTAAAAVDGGITTTSIVEVGDAGSSHRISRIAWTLTIMGVLVGGLTVWFFLATRPAPVGMAGLAEMSSSRWWKADPDKRDNLLGRSRKGRLSFDDSLLVVAPSAAAGPAAVAAGPVAVAAGTAAGAGTATEPSAPASTGLADVDLPAWARDPAPEDLTVVADASAVGAASVPPVVGDSDRDEARELAAALAGVPGEADEDPAPTPVPSEAPAIRVAPYAAEEATVPPPELVPAPLAASPAGALEGTPFTPASEPAPRVMTWAPPPVSNDSAD